MTVTQIVRKPGRWGFKLSIETPREVLDRLERFGHIAISTGRQDPRVAGDSLLRSARYVGVVRSTQLADDGSRATSSLGGAGMAFWLGDEDKKGAVLENSTPFASGSFTSTVSALLPSSGAVTAGTIHSVTGAYTGIHQWQDPRTALDYVCDTFTTDSEDPVEWRVNGDGTLDAGKTSQLYVTTPTCFVLRRDDAGVDMARRALRSTGTLAADVEDFTTRVVVIASGNGASVATGAADIAPSLNGYKDIHGNTVEFTRLVSESATSQGNATARAQLALNQFTSPRAALTLSSDEYDIAGSVSVGDYLWAFNQEIGLLDTSNTEVFRGRRINPVRLRLMEVTWPVERGMSVAYRDKNGVWLDLTDYVVTESGNTTLVVGGYNRALSSSSESVGSRPVADTSIPAAPAFTLPFAQAVYQSSQSGITKAQVQVKWVKPANTDGTLVLDGDRYEIQYRTGSVPIFPATHTQMSAYTHTQLAAGTHNQPITYTAGPWQSAYARFDDTAQLIHELTPGVPYDIRIRAYDNANPANVSDWSSTTTIQTVGDTIAPSTPDAPTVAASRISVQIMHELGRSDGGTYNLEADLHHLEIHAQYTPLYTPDDTTRIGKLLANNGMMLAGIPAIGTFPVEDVDDVYIKVIAVDEAGNKSSPSVAAQSSVLLIDNAHISDLTVSKVTAGTITAAWVLAGTIKTADTGARMIADSAGLRLYNASDVNTVDLNASTGNATITGKLQTGTSGQRIIIDPHSSPDDIARIQMYDSTSTNYVTAAVTDSTFNLQARKISDNSFHGGYYFMDLVDGGSAGSAYIGYRSTSLGTNWFHQVGSDGGHKFQGFFAKVATMGGLGALHVDQVSGSGTSASYSYGATYATTPLPFCEIQGTSGSPPTASSHAVTARSQTGFSIQYPAGNVDLFVWSVRYG